MGVLEKVEQLIRKYFNFLFEGRFVLTNSYYSEQHFGNWIMIYDSKNMKIKIRNDRDDISLAVGPRWATDNILENSHYYDLEFILAYLLGKTPAFIATGNNLDEKLAKLAQVTEIYFPRISELFELPDFELKEKELHDLTKRFH